MWDVILEPKGPVPYLMEANFKGKLVEALFDYIEAFPILAAMSIGMYALLNMISEKLARCGIIFTFAYGAIVVVYL